jgi:hypothetical protein
MENAGTNTKIELSKIKMAIKQLHNKIEEVQKATDSLHMKISDITTPFQGEISPELKPIAPPQEVKSNLLSEIQTATNNLGDLRDKIYGIERSVEL